MTKVINEQFELFEFEKSNTYDLTAFDTVIIKFDLSTKYKIKANRIICCDLTASYVSCSSIYSIGDIVCYSIKANVIECRKLISTHVRSNNVQAIEIKGFIKITAFNISCDCISGLIITCHYLECIDCYTNELNVREQHIKHMYSFNEYCI